jgi:hypothetical protein
MSSALPIKEMSGENLYANDPTQHINISILSSRNNYISHINEAILQTTRMKKDTSQWSPKSYSCSFSNIIMVTTDTTYTS